MANPTKPDIDYSYAGFQQEQQDFPFPGTQLDNDLAELETSIDQTIDALADIRRSDGALKNSIVTADSLDESLLIGLKTPTEWAAGAKYSPPDTVTLDEAGIQGVYRCRVAHTSADFEDDFAAGYWEKIFSLSPFLPVLAQVAITGQYEDLSGRPDLGTAAFLDATAFATSTQGGKADTALQPGQAATPAQGAKADNAVSFASQSLSGAQQDQAQANTRGLIIYASLAAFQAATVPAVVTVVELAERTVGNGGRSKWRRTARPGGAGDIPNAQYNTGFWTFDGQATSRWSFVANPQTQAPTRRALRSSGADFDASVGVAYQRGILNEHYPVTPGRKYTLKGVLDAIGSSKGTARVSVNWYTAADALISTSQIFSYDVASTAAIQNFTGAPVIAPATAAYARIVCEHVRDGSNIIGGTVDFYAFDFAEAGVVYLSYIQDASTAWFKLEPGQDGRYDPIALGAVGSYCIDAQTLSWFNARTVKPTGPICRAVDDLIVRLKSTIGLRTSPLITLWSKLTELYVLRGDTVQSRLLNLVDPTKSLVETGAITYNALGAAGDGAASFLASPTNINALPGVTQNSVTMGVFAHTDGPENNDAAGLVGTVVSNNGDIYITPKAAGFMRTRCGDATSTPGTKTLTNSLGFFAVSRSASGSYRQFIDDQEPETISVASVALANGPLHIGKTVTTGGTTWFNGSAASIVFTAVGMTNEEMRLLYRILRDFLVKFDDALTCPAPALTSADIDATPFDCQPAFQAAIDLADVFAPTPRGIKDTWWLGDEIKVDSNRTFDGTWRAYFRLMATAPAAANCIGNKDKTNGNTNIKIKNCRWDWNRLNRGTSATRPGLSCIVLAKVTRGVIQGNYCQATYLHSINASSNNETYQGMLNWKDGTNGSDVDICSYDITIDGNYCTDFGDDGITAHWISRITITNNMIWHSANFASKGSSGIESDDGSRYVVIQNNQVWECDLENSTGISIKGHGLDESAPGTPAGHTATVSGNIIRKCANGFLAAHEIDGEFNGQAITFVGNVVTDTRGRGVWFNRCKSFVCSGNSVLRTSLYTGEGAIRLTELADLNTGVVSDNVIDDSGLSTFALFVENNVPNLVISSNNIKNCISGIYGNAPGITITGNRVVAGTPTGGGAAATGLLVGSAMVNGLAVGNNMTGFANNINGSAHASAVVANNRSA